MKVSTRSLPPKAAAPQDPRDTFAWTAYIAALYPGKVKLRDATEPERRAWNRKVRVYGMLPAVRRHVLKARTARPDSPRRGREHRPAASRRASSSSTTSGSDPGDPEPEPPTAEPWRWAQPNTWMSFAKDIQGRITEREIARERDAGWSR